MKIHLMALFLILLTVVISHGQDETPVAHPKAVVADNRYAFQTVPEGTRIEHDFIIRNSGNGPLTIESVAKSCSCITILSHDKTIAPNARGVISVRLDTSGYGGKDLERSLNITTNEPGNPVIELMLSGKVETVYSMTPKIAKLEGRSGERINTSIMVIPEPKYPFKILAIRAESEDRIQFQLEETMWEGRSAFRLHITNKRKEPGRYLDHLSLTTDSQAVPTIRIGVFGHIKETG